MKAESNHHPGVFHVEQCKELAEVVMYENVEQKQRNGEIFFVYDEHRLNVPWRDNLLESIERYTDEWLKLAKRKASEEAAT